MPVSNSIPHSLHYFMFMNPGGIFIPYVQCVIPPFKRREEWYCSPPKGTNDGLRRSRGHHWYIPSWNTDFLASNNFFHTLLIPGGFLIERDFSIHRDLSSGIFTFTEIFSFLSRVFSFTLIWIFDLY